MLVPMSRVLGALPARLTPTRLRLLPLLIFVSALFLSVKVDAIRRGADAWLRESSLSMAEAQARPAAPANPEPLEAHAADPAEDAAGGHAAPAAGGAPVSAEPPPQQAPAFSPAEVAVLRQLAKRREALDEREGELEKRAAMLRAAESRIDAKAQALKALQADVAALINKHDNQQDAKIASLAKLYESMKPKDAAAILQALDIDTLLLVAERMKERKLAPIMAQMNPARAREMTLELVRLREIDGKIRSGRAAGGGGD